MGLAAGLVAGIGSLAGGAAMVGSSAMTNATNSQIAQQQEQFQEQMSNTSYQRGVQDMEAAGINPMMAYSQGGASSPPGAAIAMQNPVSQNLVGSAVSSALDMQKTEAAVKNVEQQTKVGQATQALTLSNAAKAAAQVPGEQAKSIVSESLLPALKAIGDRVQPVASSAGQVVDWFKKKSGELGSWIGDKTNPELASPNSGGISGGTDSEW